MDRSPADILSATAGKRKWKAPEIARRLDMLGVSVTDATVRNWLRGDSVPLDPHRLPLVHLFGLDRDEFLTACCAHRREA